MGLSAEKIRYKFSEHYLLLTGGGSAAPILSRKSTLSLKTKKSSTLKSQGHAQAQAEDGIRDLIDCE